jgi:ribosomal protein S18 acetylase RimI-like enzyme
MDIPVSVRSPQVADLDRIVEISRENFVRPEERQHHSGTGFISRKRSPKEYHDLVTSSSNSVVAITTERVIGYILAYDKKEAYLLKKDQNTHIPLISKWNNDEDFVFISQIAVHPDYAGRGVAQTMLDRVQSEEKNRILFASVSIDPVENKKSRRFFSEKNGWQPLEEFSVNENTYMLYASRKIH